MTPHDFTPSTVTTDPHICACGKHRLHAVHVPKWVHVAANVPADHIAKPFNAKRLVRRCMVCGRQVVKAGTGDYR